MIPQSVAPDVNPVTDYLSGWKAMFELSNNREPLNHKFLTAHGHSVKVTGGHPLSASGPLGMCFKNCLLLTMEDPRYVYLEGIAVSQELGVPMDHALIYDRELQQVFDPTWRYTDSTAVVCAFDRWAVIDFALRVGVYGVFGNMYRLRDNAEAALNTMLWRPRG